MNTFVLLIVLLSEPGERVVFGVIQGYDTLQPCLDKITEMVKETKEHVEKFGCMQVMKKNRLGKGFREAEAEEAKQAPQIEEVKK